MHLNYSNYPLVVGNADKLTFCGWEECGSTVTLHAFTESMFFSDEEIRWNAEDETIVQILQTNGKTCTVRGRTTGVTYVTAMLPDGEKADCCITVIDNITRGTTRQIVLNTEKVILKVKDTAQLLAMIYPMDLYENVPSGGNDYVTAKAMNRELLWISSDTSVAAVEDGRVTARGCGRATITVISKDVGREAYCTVEVVDECVVTGIKGGMEVPAFLCVGDKVLLHAEPIGGASKIHYCSTNMYVLNVDDNGMVTATANSNRQIVSSDNRNVSESPECVDIIATTEVGGFSTTFSFYVKEPVRKARSLFLAESTIYMRVGECTAVKAVPGPSYLVSPRIIWSSSNENVVKVAAQEKTVDGLCQCVLEATDVGTVSITAKCDDIVQTCEIVVLREEGENRRILLEKHKYLSTDEVFRLWPQGGPLTIGQEIVWLSTNRNVVTVNQEGIIQGYQNGEAAVYAVLINKDNISGGEIEELRYLSAVRRIAEDQELECRLKKLLKKMAYGESRITVGEGMSALRNLHAPKEALRDHSAVLLWNRAPLSDVSNLSHYEIFEGGRLLARTDKLSSTIKELEAGREYLFSVRAIDKNGVEMERKSIRIKTKKESFICNVLEAPFYAIGDGSTMDTIAIQKAIDHCPAGGTVLLPEKHVFITGALFLKSDIVLQIDGILIGSDNPKDYPWVVSRWEGFRKLPQSQEEWPNSTVDLPYNTYVRASLLNAGTYDEGKCGSIGPFNVENIVICGHGQVNGNGFRLAFNEGPNQADYGGGRPVPFSPIMNQTFRGSLLRIHNGRNIYVADITFAYGPGWQVHPIYCDQITFNHLSMVSKGDGVTGATDDICILNGDGIDPESCSNINIIDCEFFCGDDSVTLKSGRNREGNELRKPAQYIRVTDCVTDGSKAGFVIGSEIASGAHDILWQNLKVKNITWLPGIWIKTMRPRGGKIVDIQYRDISFENVDQPIRVSMVYDSVASTDSAVNPAEEVPDIGYLTFSNMTDLGGCEAGYLFSGTSEAIIHDIKIEDSSFLCPEEKLEVYFCENFKQEENR